MKKQDQPEVVISGIGITSAIGIGKNDFFSALMAGKHAFGIMQRPGRQQNGSRFLGAEIAVLNPNNFISKRLLRSASFSGQVALLTLQEAWDEANLKGVDPRRIGLVVGGSNVQQREILQFYQNYSDRPQFIRPTYGLSFMDSDLCGLCTEQFKILGPAYTLGGASASGQAAIIQAVQAIQAGTVDICIAVGALMDISYMECQALRALGAMGSDRYADAPELSCRPFDSNRDGFIYGEGCGVLILERSDTARERKVKPYAEIAGWAIAADGNRNPNPSYEGEIWVIKNSLAQASIDAKDIDYINPHGTGSLIGDEIELKALQACQLSHAYINATKSITGHGLSAAGAVEVIATLLQMKESRLHLTRNLLEPMDSSFNWVQGKSISHVINNALSLSMGFGGINTAVCLKKI